MLINVCKGIDAGRILHVLLQDDLTFMHLEVTVIEMERRW